MTDDEIRALIDAHALTFTNAILALQTRIIALEGRPAPTGAAEPPPPPDPRWWRDRATEEDWAGLSDWVDRLNSDGSLMQPNAVPSCWQEHPGLVEELAALYESWRDAMVAQETGVRTRTGSIESSIWFTQALWPVLERLRSDSQRYQSQMCVARHRADTPVTR